MAAAGGYTLGMNRAGSVRAGSWVVPALTGLVGAARLTFLCRLPDRLLIRHIPDDAFYYLVMGRNFAHTGRWTFDGTEPASGFHLLWGYLLAAMYWVAPAISTTGALLVAGVIDIVSATLAAWLTVRTASRLFGAGSQVGVAVVMLSALALQWDVNLMETAVVLLASAAVLDYLCRRDASDSRSAMAAGFGLGLLGMLARSDFGMLPLCLFAASLIFSVRRQADRAMVRRSGAVLAGAVLGLAVVLLHTHWISGGWAQASAQQKLWWASQNGFSTVPVWRMLWYFFWIPVANALPLRAPTLLAGAASQLILLALVVGLAMKLRESDGPASAVVGICATLVGFVLFYRFNSSELQSWYVGNLEIPVALLASGGAAWLVARQRALSIGIAGVACGCGIWLSFEPTSMHQAALYQAGIYLAQHPELKPVGSWNAGIISYYGGGGVTNLDGLVNDRILPFAKTGTVGDYVRRRELKNLIDFGIWLSPLLATRAGDAGGDLRRCVDERMLNLPDGAPDLNNPARIFAIRPDCLR